jgi:hypothetical protein
VTAALGSRYSPSRLLGSLAVAFFVLAGSAMLRTSTTFDEIVFSAAGARAIKTGDFSMIADHPRLPQYLYGVPTWLTATNYPSEQASNWNMISRYHYARALLWGVGNTPERMILAARLVGLAFGLATVLAAYFLGRRYLGEEAALFGAALIAFLPDMLGHSGVAYNDVPLAFGLLASVYALDGAVRDPTRSRVAIAALVCALTACVKYSGLIVGPVLAVLLALEALSGRWRDGRWVRSITTGVPVFLAVAWATIALVYLGDWRLADYFGGLADLTRSSSAGRVAFLLGERNVGGWWYFYPAAFALKTPVALHVLMLVALAGAWFSMRAGGARQWMTHGARAPAAGAILLIAAVTSSGFNIGLRHILPAIPLVCILVAHGVAPVWRQSNRAVRIALATVFAAFVLSSVKAYPNFLSYLSEYASGRDVGDTLVDSNTDWGQGLPELRKYLLARGIERVALGYFGSAVPDAYDIRYVPMPSFLELPRQEPWTGPPPRFLVVSATLLAGLYVRGDPYAPLRHAQPVAIVGGTLYVFDRESLGTL